MIASQTKAEVKQVGCFMEFAAGLSGQRSTFLTNAGYIMLK